MSYLHLSRKDPFSEGRRRKPPLISRVKANGDILRGVRETPLRKGKRSEIWLDKL
jgi:hypothetical protein